MVPKPVDLRWGTLGNLIPAIGYARRRRPPPMMEPDLALMHPRLTYSGFLRRRAGVVSGDTVNAPWGYRTGSSRHAVTPTPQVS